MGCKDTEDRWYTHGLTEVVFRVAPAFAVCVRWLLGAMLEGIVSVSCITLS